MPYEDVFLIAGFWTSMKGLQSWVKIVRVATLYIHFYVLLLIQEYSG